MITAAGGSASLTVVQGEHRVARDQDVMLTTLLGSCVAACLWDGVARVGGMNHFLLPDRGAPSATDGVHAMAVLIDDLLAAGARRERLRAKLFGGARIRVGLTDIGERNAGFAECFLAGEGIALAGGSLRGERGRRVQFWPMSGRARQVYLEPSADPRLLPPMPGQSRSLEMA